MKTPARPTFGCYGAAPLAAVASINANQTRACGSATDHAAKNEGRTVAKILHHQFAYQSAAGYTQGAEGSHHALRQVVATCSLGGTGKPKRCERIEEAGPQAGPITNRGQRRVR
jgi:hypothetical protein